MTLTGRTIDRSAWTILSLVAMLTIGTSPARSEDPPKRERSKAAAKSPSAKTEAAKPKAETPKTKTPEPKPKPKAGASKERQKAIQKKMQLGEVEDQFPTPVIAFVYPAGAQRGKTVSLTVNGTHLKGTTGVRITGQGVSGTVTEVPDEHNVEISLTVAADAQLGERDLRVLGPGGVSNRFRFFVGELPEVNEVEPNSEPATAQVIHTLPVTVNGQVMEGERDCFRFSAKAGQTLVFDVSARRILPFIADAVPSWFEACLTLYDGAGKRLAYQDDFRHRTDPLMVFEVPKDGEYVVEIRDVLYRGRGDFVYRLRMGELIVITDVFPMGCLAGMGADVQFRGVNLPGSLRSFSLPVTANDGIGIRLGYRNVKSNGVWIVQGELPETMENEPNDTLAKAQTVTMPCVVNGRSDRPGDADLFMFEAKAGQTLVMEVVARRLDSPLDSILTLLDSQGRELMENDDTVDPEYPLLTHHADSRLQYKFSTAGKYCLRLRDVQGRGGPEYAYRLSIAPPQPSFNLRVVPDNLRIAPGETAMLTVNALRKDGFKGEIEIKVNHLPAGYKASDAVMPAGQDQVALTVTAPKDALLGVYAPTITGRATIGIEAVEREAEAAESVMQAFTWTHIVPTREYSMAVVKTPEVPLKLSLGLSPSGTIEVPQGGEATVKVAVARQGDAKGGVIVAALGLPQGLQCKTAWLTPDATEAALVFTATPRLAVGMRQNVVIRGTLRSGKTGASIHLPATPVVIVEKK